MLVLGKTFKEKLAENFGEQYYRHILHSVLEEFPYACADD